MESACDTLIVGAGLAGLSAAWHLKDKGGVVCIVERSTKVGGLTSTEEKQGFYFDHTGHLLHLRDETIKKWVIEELFKGKIKSVERESRVWSWDAYTHYPFQANTYGLPQHVADECVREYLKVLEHPPKRPVKTAEDFIYRHFGKGFAKHFMIPYNRKIWGIHPKEMSATWGERFIPVPKKEDVLAGAKAESTKKLGYNTRFLYPDKGMGALSAHIHQALPSHIYVEFKKELQKIDFKKKVAYFKNGKSIRYKTLINTIPLKEFLEKLIEPPTQIKRQSKLLKYRSLRYLNIALNMKTPIAWQWCYVPSPKVPFYRVGVYNNISSTLVPRGCSSLYVELSARTYTKTVLSKVLAELTRMGVIKNKKDIRFIDEKFIKYAYVIYDKNYYKVVPKIHDFLNSHDIYSIGRWGAWNYSSMEDALQMGREVAKMI